jgi:hypothetical protein
MSEPPDWWLHLHRGRGVRHDDGPPEMVEIAGEVRAATEKAVQFYDGKVTVWLPRSQIEETEGGLRVAKWLALKNGLI